MGELPRLTIFEPNKLNTKSLNLPYYPHLLSRCGNLWHERSHSTVPNLSSFPSRKRQSVTPRNMLWTRMSGSLISPSYCPTVVHRVRNREREYRIMSSSLRLQRRNTDKSRREELRGGYDFDYGLIHTGKCPLMLIHDVRC